MDTVTGILHCSLINPYRCFMGKYSFYISCMRKCFFNLIEKFKWLINKLNYKKRKTDQECLIHSIAKRKTENVAIGLKSLIDGFVKTYTHIAEAKGLIFAGIYNGNDITVYVDYKHLIELIDNLLNNAIECTSQGFIILNIEFVKNKLIICIADSGKGMTESQIQLFNLSEMKFGNTDLSERLGRNLTDTLGLVNLLRGSIKLLSDGGQRCKFVIQLPVSVCK